MRKQVTDRYYKLFTGQPVDRVPDDEFGYWPQTIRRWLKEGLPPEEFEPEKNKMFSAKLDEFFGFDRMHRVQVSMRMWMNPAFEDEVIERQGSSVIRRGSDGVVVRHYPSEADESSIPHFIKFPVETPEDWAALKERYRMDDPVREPKPEELQAAREDPTRMVTAGANGFYGQLRNWMGMENLSLAFFEYPDMIHDMVSHWSAMAVRSIEAWPADIPLDYFTWWEDMASKNGPLVSPRMFREFLQPGYRLVMQAAKKRGCAISIVDCDGNPHDIVRNWLEEGVNIMFPLEVAAGVDPYAWRQEFGMDLRLKGAIAKAPLVRGGAAIDRELERIKPLLGQGGYMPHLDHLVPPDISFKNYMEYLEKKRKLIGK